MKKFKLLITLAFSVVLFTGGYFTAYGQGAVTEQTGGVEVTGESFEAVSSDFLEDDLFFEEFGDLEFNIIARVNIYDAYISFFNDETNTYILEFDIDNAGDVQPDVNYVIELYEVLEEGFALVDQQTLEDAFSVSAGEVIHKTVTYHPPEHLEGEHEMRILVANSSGLLYGGNIFGTVQLKKNNDGIYIDPKTCFLKIEGDEEEYYPMRGIDVKTEEALTLHCDIVKSTIESTVTVVPTIVVRERTRFGAVVGEKTLESITLENGASVALSFVIPKTEIPQAYQEELYFVIDGKKVSNSIEYRYILIGDSATIQNLAFDKDFYNTGEVAQMTVFVSGAAHIFPEARHNDSTVLDAELEEELYVDVELRDAQGLCTESVFRQRVETDGFLNFALPITKECKDYTATATVKNAQGEVLDQKVLAIESKNYTPPTDSVKKGSQSSATSLALLVVILTLGLIAYIMHVQKKRKETDQTEGNESQGNVPLNMNALLPLFFFGFLFSLIGGQEVKADTFTIGNPGKLNTVVGYYQTNKSSYACEENVQATAQMRINVCSNITLHWLATARGQSLIDYHQDLSDGKHQWKWFETSNHSRWIGSYPPGNHNVNFYFLWERYYGSGYRGKKGSDGSWVCSRCDGKNRWDEKYKNDCPCYENIYATNRNIGIHVGACVNYTHSATPSGCARTGDNTRNGKATVSITGANVSVASYGFKCGPQAWVYKNTNTHTCDFGSPGTYNIRTSIRNSSGTTLLSKNSNVTIPTCACDPYTTFNFTVNGASASTASVDQGVPFNVVWNFAHPTEAYSCKFTPPSVSTLAPSNAHAGNHNDTIPTALGGPTATTPYTFSCTGPDTCPSVSRTIQTRVVPPPLSVSISSVPATPIEVVDLVRFTATPSGGVPNAEGQYNYTWSGAVSGSGTNATTPLGNYIERHFGSLGPQTVSVTVTDTWNQTASDTLNVTIQDSRTPQ